MTTSQCISSHGTAISSDDDDCYRRAALNFDADSKPKSSLPLKALAILSLLVVLNFLFETVITSTVKTPEELDAQEVEANFEIINPSQLDS